MGTNSNPGISFTSETFNANINEGAATGSDVTRVTVNNQLSSVTSFEFVGGNDDNSFLIHPNQGNFTELNVLIISIFCVTNCQLGKNVKSFIMQSRQKMFFVKNLKRFTNV